MKVTLHLVVDRFPDLDLILSKLFDQLFHIPLILALKLELI
jgi:hypothetical protein